MKNGEDIRNAARREIKEETGIVIRDFERKLGVYKNTLEGKNDTVTILIAKNWEIGPIKRGNVLVKGRSILIHMLFFRNFFSAVACISHTHSKASIKISTS